jgi:hypothetical protein
LGIDATGQGQREVPVSRATALAAFLLVALCYALAMTVDAEAQPFAVPFDCHEWEQGASVSRVMNNICRRQAILREQ